jgi:hypothetical protein
MPRTKYLWWPQASGRELPDAEMLTANGHQLNALLCDPFYKHEQSRITPDIAPKSLHGFIIISEKYCKLRLQNGD